MRGKVEVFAIASDGTQTRIASDPNLVVDGAGQCIADMLTVPSSTLGISPRVMDTSNWRFGALSFGPAGQSFSGNAYFFPEKIGDVRVFNKDDDLCNGVSADVTSWFNQINTDKKIRVRWVSGSIGNVNGATASSYTPPYRLPSFPSPLNKKLEDSKTLYSTVSADGTESFGQFENHIQFAPNDASSYFQGAYARNDPANSGNDGHGTSAMLVSSYDGNFQADTSANMIVFHNTYGEYNKNAVMDKKGFITAQYNITNPGASLARVSVSGSTSNDLTGATSQVSIPKVTVTTTISAKDTWLMNLYGGLHQIGLWNMDTLTALKSNAAPFLEGNPVIGGDPKFINTATGLTKQKFKLFAKKSFSNNLTQIRDVGSNAGMQNSQNLKIEWTLDLRSQHD